MTSSLWFFFIRNNMEKYLDRMSDFYTDDFGSGRIDLYTLPIERWLNSDNFFNLIFGYGFDSASSYYVSSGRFESEFYTHSDWVSMLHDFGFIGIILLSAIFINLFTLSRKNLVIKIASIILFLKSIFSGFIIYSYTIFGVAVIGLVLGINLRLKTGKKII